MSWGITNRLGTVCMIINLDTGAYFYWTKYQNVWHLYFNVSRVVLCDYREQYDNIVPISVMEIFEQDFSFERCNNIMETIFNKLKNNESVDFDTIKNVSKSSI